MRTYETNYAQLVSLLPRGESEHCHYVVFEDEYQLRILEQTRYTTLVHITQQNTPPAGVETGTDFTVRLYHDARVAEVCATGQTARLKAKYDYPNSKMYQQNEKHQVNQFLREWLTHCLRYGVTKSAACKLN
uniref:DUF1249 domain-containing protein n=1 Tax=Thaumasiovibrio occultus TaxID=1891184 RepID=UPI000B35DE6E|nr:DUF1249 domain-containing protein [Thaumasiovibrio occultus]